MPISQRRNFNPAISDPQPGSCPSISAQSVDEHAGLSMEQAALAAAATCNTADVRHVPRKLTLRLHSCRSFPYHSAASPTRTWPCTNPTSSRLDVLACYSSAFFGTAGTVCKQHIADLTPHPAVLLGRSPSLAQQHNVIQIGCATRRMSGTWPLIALVPTPGRFCTETMFLRRTLEAPQIQTALTSPERGWQHMTHHRQRREWDAWATCCQKVAENYHSRRRGGHQLWCIFICHPHLTSIICCTGVWAQACGLERKTSFVIIVHLWFIRRPRSFFAVVGVLVGAVLLVQIIRTFATVTIFVQCVLVNTLQYHHAVDFCARP